MDAYAFLASLVNSLAWPVVVLMVVWRLHKPIEALIPLLATVKYKDWEIDFDQRMDAADAESRDLAAIPAHSFAASQAMGAAIASPRATIENAWAGVESAVKEFAKNQKLSPGFLQPSDAASVMRVLQQAGTVTTQQAALFANLNSLRNSAVHLTAFMPTAEEAARFAAIAGRLRQSLA